MQIKKKLTRKQFLAKDDEFISFMKNAVQWLKKNANLLIFVIVGIGIGVAVILGVRYKKEANLTSSSKLLTEARLNYEGKVEGEPTTDEQQSEKSFKTKEEKYEATISALDQLLELYPSSPGAEDALFLKADVYYQQGEYDKAVLTYQQYLDKYKSKGVYKAQALSSIGYSHEAKGNYQEAVRAFQKVIDDCQDYLLRDSIFMELGRCYEQVQDWERARDAYQKVVINFPDSPMLKDAQEKLDTLTTAASPTGKGSEGVDNGKDTEVDGGKVIEGNSVPESGSAP